MGVNTPAYTLTPYGLIISLHISLPLGKVTEKDFAFIFTITIYWSICYNYEGKLFAFIILGFSLVFDADCAEWLSLSLTCRWMSISHESNHFHMK